MKSAKGKSAVGLRIKRGDDVVFVSGREFNRYDSDGKRSPYQGKVIEVDPSGRKVKVDGAMMVKRHKKAVPQMNVKGGIISKEAWVDISNVAIVDPDTGKPSRVKYELRDGAKVRIAKSGAVIPEPGMFKRAEAPVEETEAAAEETTDDTEEAAAEVDSKNEEE